MLPRSELRSPKAISTVAGNDGVPEVKLSAKIIDASSRTFTYAFVCRDGYTFKPSLSVVTKVTILSACAFVEDAACADDIKELRVVDT